jgi:hypothetical protein
MRCASAQPSATTWKAPKRRAARLCVKIAGRIDRKVDSDKLQELAAEHGLTDHLSRLFRWKPEISMALWKAADESITQPLAPVLSRPSLAAHLSKSLIKE